MTEITSKQVKELREKTGAGMMDCRKALIEADGNIEKSIEYLREKGIASASKKASRSAKEGLVFSYIHNNEKIGTIIEINCETDFVARTEDFKDLCKEIAMQVAAMNPGYVKREDVPQEVIDKEKEIYRAQMKETKKPDNVIEKILTGKLNKYFEEVCLVEQEYIKDNDKKIGDLVNEKISKLGENIVIKRFVRFAVGEN